MKKQLNFLAGLAILVLGSTTTTTAQNHKESCSASCSHHKVQTQAVTFEKGKVYEIAYAEVDPEKATQLNEQYFPKAMPLMAKYGAKMIGGFEVVKNDSKNLPANMVAIFEWPNAEARLKLLKDKDFKRIAHLRDEALTGINLGYFEVAETKSITFRSDKVYEFGAADLYAGETAKANLNKYFEVSEPIKRNYGGAYPEFIMNFQTTESKGQATYEPQMQFIVEWDSLEDNEKLFANEDFNTNAVPLMMKAIAKFDAAFTTFAFN